MPHPILAIITSGALAAGAGTGALAYTDPSNPGHPQHWTAAEPTENPRPHKPKTGKQKPRWIGRTTCPPVRTVHGVRVVTVRTGDSTAHIATCTRTTTTAIVNANDLTRGGNLIRVGQKLEIPKATR